jgi:UDP-perosamine 4-acetyltransferase
LTADAICVVLGGGGHARVVLEALRLSDQSIRCVILDARRAGSVDGVPVVGDDRCLPKLRDEGARRFIVAVGSSASTQRRQELFALARSYGLEPVTVLHPSAICSANAVIATGAQVLQGSIVNAGASIGTNAIVNSGAIVEHGCDVGAHAHIATGARLAGGVVVGVGAHIGISATVRQGIRVGTNAVVGAGAVVIDDVPADALVVGVPARPMHAAKDR